MRTVQYTCAMKQMELNGSDDGLFNTVLYIGIGDQVCRMDL
jgi:hypothetical protein